MTTLVFGSKGFIGQAILKLYDDLGLMDNTIIASRDIKYSKYILDRFPMARILNLPIRSSALNLQFRDEIDKVLYLSGVYDLQRKDKKITDNEILQNHFDINVVRLIEELQDCVIAFKSLTKVVYASSQAVDISLKTVTSQDIGIENLAYGLNKHLAEKISSYFLNNSLIKFHPLRIGTVYGPGEPSHRFAFQLISSFSRNMPFLVNNSNNERNYVYVLDLAKYIFKVLETDILRSEKEIYLAGKETFTIKEYSENLKVAWETKTGDTADVQYMSSISTNNLSLMEYDSQFISSIPNTSLSVASEKFVNWFIAGTPNLIVDYL